MLATIDETTQLQPEDIGLRATRPGGDTQWGAFTMDIFEGVLPAGCRHGFFAVHGVTNDQLSGAHPIPKGMIEKDQRSAVVRARNGKPSFRACWLKGDNLGNDYLATIDGLNSVIGSGVVNAVRVMARDGTTSVTTFPTSCCFPESFTMREHRQVLLEEFWARAVACGQMGVGPDGIIGLGALWGIKTFARLLPTLDLYQDRVICTGNVATGAAIGDGVQMLANRWARRHGRQPLIAIIGATGGVAMVAVERLSRTHTGGLMLAARTKVNLVELANRLPNHDQIVIVDGETAAAQAAASADIIVFLTSDARLAIEPTSYRPNAIVYDAGRPRSNPDNLPELRPDLVVLDGPTFLVPGSMLRPDLFGLRHNELLPCMTEVTWRNSVGNVNAIAPPRTVHEFRAEEVREAADYVLAQMSRDGFKRAPWERWHKKEILHDDVL